MKLDLSDTTFLIPIRIDSIDRLENILAVIKFLRHYFNTNIMVLEASTGTNSFLMRLLPKDRKVNYMFIHDDDPIFFRTHYINMMAKETHTPIIAVWDADAIIPVKQIMQAVEQIRLGRADVSHPYDGTCLEASDILRQLFIQTGNVKYLEKNLSKMKVLYQAKSMTGGGFFLNTDKYKQAGMENEHFYGWGPEDFERYSRWQAFDYKLFRTEGFMVHLTHQRDINSHFNSVFQMKNLNLELARTRNSSRNQIIQHLKLNINEKNEN